jgi:hypothetical protein
MMCSRFVKTTRPIATLSMLRMVSRMTAKASCPLSIGVPAYYIDETIGQGIVKLMPDRTIRLIDPDQDADVVLRTIMPGR